MERRSVTDDSVFAPHHHGATDGRVRVVNTTRNAELGDAVETADQGAKRRKGLLGRAALLAGEGLWIVPCEAVHTFGMQFAIDLVYLDRNQRVKKTRGDMDPWRISGCLPAYSVLELPAGSVRRTGTVPGDRVEFTPAHLAKDGPHDSDQPDAADAKDRHSPAPAPMKWTAKLGALGEILVVGICTMAFAMTFLGVCLSALGKNSAGSHDFVEYWASGQLLVHHASPYDAKAVFALERSVGFPPNTPVLMPWQPPSAMLLVLPLGFLGASLANVLWMLLLIGCLVTAVRMIWTMHGRPRGPMQLLGYSFAPVLACLLAGQVAILVMLGLVLFLRLQRSRPFLAGVSLWLCMLKPHLFVPFGVVLLVWIVRTRSYRIVAGTVLALGVSTGTILLLDPAVWTQYHQMVKESRFPELIPCVSIFLNRAINRDALWISYIPVALGCVWSLAYFRKHRDSWDWVEHGSLLMMVSVVAAPYSWLLDQTVLLPAVLHAVSGTSSRKALAILALASATVELGTLFGLSLLHSAWFVWTAPGWLAWYVYATRPASTSAAPHLGPAGGEVATGI